MRHSFALSATALGVVGVLVLATVLPHSDPQRLEPTGAAAATSVHFTAAGDFSSSADAQAVFAGIGASAPDLHLALGDLSYGATGAEQAWCDLVLAAVAPGFAFQLVAGNHESNGLNGNINDFAACLPNQLPGLVGVYGRQWYVDVPQTNPLVRYVMISPNMAFPGGTWVYNAGSPRYNWTAAAIDGARSRSIPWVVVGMHFPCFSMGQYSCGVGTDLNNLLLAKKVDLVLSGHEHGYQRTHQLATGPNCGAILPGAAANPNCVADSDNTLTKGRGTVFATVGTGGVVLRDMNTGDPEAPYFAAFSGLNANPTFGSLDVNLTAESLTASFARASGGTFADSFVIGPSTGNNPPTAAFTSNCTHQACSFDASTSGDPDGFIVNYAWTFGDGASASGASASHSYGAAGSFPVTLTVTDNMGATASTTRSVSVVAPPSVFARDAFGRTVPAGWGTAELGGNWTVSSTSIFSTTDGAGRLRVAAGAGPTASLNAVSSSTADMTMTVATDKPATGSGLYFNALARRVSNAGDYRATVWLQSSGRVALALSHRTAAGAETSLAAAISIPGLTYTVGDRLQVRVQAIGANPTTLQAKVWKVGTPEPVTWQRTATDSTSGLQTSGGIGLYAYLSGSATNSPITVAVDDLVAAST